jgi:hypothetical protein
MKSVFLALCLLATACVAQVIPVTGTPAGAPTSSIIGQLQTATGGTINNGTLTFVLSQPAVVSGSSSVVASAVSCYTSSAGNVVGIPDPLASPAVSANLASGSLLAGTYYVKLASWVGSTLSLPSPETVFTLTGTGTLLVSAPAVQPTSASGYNVYIGTSSGAETLQGTVTGWTPFSQASALVAGSVLPLANSSVCNIYFSDQLIPTGTYYTVSLTNRNGSTIAGFPQTWCTYGGAGGTINVSNGAPTGNCNVNGVFYPTPIFANPQNSGAQSVSGPLIVTSLQASQLQNLIYLGPFSQWASYGDLGQQYTAATTALCPATGCIVHIPPGSYIIGAGHEINAVSNNRPISIVCDQGAANATGFFNTGVTTITYTGSGPAPMITLNGGGNNGVTLSGCALVGPNLSSPWTSGSSIGLSLSNATGNLTGARIKDVSITGFATGLQFGSNFYLSTFENLTLVNNGVNVLYPSSASNSGEGVLFIGGSMSEHNPAGATAALQGCADFEGATAINLSFYNVSFDNCPIKLNGNGLAHYVFTASHMENPNGPLTSDGTATGTPVQYLQLGSSCGVCQVLLDGADIYDHNTANTRGQLIDLLAGHLTITGGDYRASASIAQVVNGSGSNYLTVLNAQKANATNWQGGAISGSLLFDPANDLLQVTGPVPLWMPASDTLTNIATYMTHNGQLIYCSNCKNITDDAATADAACIAGGHGAVAKFENSVLRCN